MVADGFFRDMNVLISFEDGSTELRQKFVWFDIMLITLMITRIIHSSAESFFSCPVSRFSIIQNTFHRRLNIYLLVSISHNTNELQVTWAAMVVSPISRSSSKQLIFMLGDSEERRDLETRMRSFLLSHFARLRTGQILQ